MHPQARPLMLNICLVIVINDIKSKSCERRLITKGHIATHTNLMLLFKPALYSVTLVINLKQWHSLVCTVGRTSDCCLTVLLEYIDLISVDMTYSTHELHGHMPVQARPWYKVVLSRNSHCNTIG